jgi:hypothetical protein
MIGTPKKTIDRPQKEALISLTALYFIEEHHLLPKDKLVDAKNSLQALFLRTSGEETLLRKLIEILKTTQRIHLSFASIANILDGIPRGVATVDGKLAVLRQLLEQYRVSAEENTDFVGPFLSFSQDFLKKIEAFSRNLPQYLGLKEEEARLTSVYRIAREARARLKQRLSGGLGAEAESEVEDKIKQEVISSFDYSEAESNLKFARRESRNKEAEIHEQLLDIRAACQMAMNPTMREKLEFGSGQPVPVYEDVFARFSSALRRHPRLLQIKDTVLELFKLYQHCYGMFSLDFANLTRSIGTMMDNTEAYFEAKDEDRDIRAKREKLRKIEGLIPFLEHTAETMADEELDSYSKFSRRISDIVSESKAPWVHISEDVLRAKIQAEAELSTQLE